jgi:hypothetical protein
MCTAIRLTCVALKWTEMIDLAPSAATSTTNHTGALLVGLLSNPFRHSSVNSVWHQQASEEDHKIWAALLKVVVLRFKAKRVGSNLGVLDTLAGHLADFLEPGEKTSSTTITLSCLATAISQMSFVTKKHDHESHYNINENFVPVDLLTVVSNALLDAYPQNESTPAAAHLVISPAVSTLLQELCEVFSEMPSSFVVSGLDPLKTALGVWMADHAMVAASSSQTQTR